MCKTCIMDASITCTLVTMLFGWWSLAFLLIAPFTLVNNTVVFFTALGMETREKVN